MPNTWYSWYSMQKWQMQNVLHTCIPTEKCFINKKCIIKFSKFSPGIQMQPVS